MVTWQEFVEIAYETAWNGGSRADNKRFLDRVGSVWKANKEALRRMSKTEVREALR